MRKPLMARLDSHINSMEELKGDDVCAGCDEVYCNQQPACGYVQVKYGSIMRRLSLFSH